MALERAYSDVPEFTSEDQAIENQAQPGVGLPATAPHLVDLTVLERRADLWGRIDRVGTRGLDIVVSTLVLVFLGPLIGVIWLAIRFNSPGSAIYRHKRLGRNGGQFECFKFRTMVDDADAVIQELFASNPHLEEEFARCQKLKDDPRVTPIGRFLRKTSLDELPQFWNVLRGEMSVVGPRPIIEEEAVRFGADLGTVLSVRPGITGLWQISGRNDLTYDQRVALDRRYVLTRTLVTDLVIIAKTPAAALLRRDGAY